MKILYKVLLPHGKFFQLEYYYEGELTIGQVVNIPFGKKQFTGVICAILKKPIVNYHKELKPLATKFPSKFIEFLEESWFATFSKPNIKPYLSALKKKPSLGSNPEFSQKKPIFLNEEQSRVSQNICQFFGQFKPFLLWGVTGSGKTEIFFELISKTKPEEQILILVPEILLLNNLKARLETLFKTSITIWNSKQRNKTSYESILNGSTKIIIGSRSSLFLPFKNLKLIIVDEEHDKSYQQTSYPYYHSRDLCLIKARIEGIPLVFATATPSLDIYHKAQEGLVEIVSIKTRYNEGKMPPIETYKLPRESLFNPEVKSQIQDSLARKEQVLVYFNRRGFAPVVYCKLCFTRVLCNSCSLPMVYHQLRQRFQCHTCKSIRSEKTCSKCRKETLFFGGLGIEKLKEVVENEFSGHNTAILSSDYIETQEEINNLFQRINSPDTDIILGTQLVVKGHNFHRISLVVVLNMDFMCLDLYYREHLFQNLIQLAGRSGRGSTQGKLLVQTNQPDHWLLKYLKDQDLEGFLQQELIHRKEVKFPPYYKIFRIFTTNKEPFEKFGMVYVNKDNLILCTENVTNELLELLNEFGAEKNPLFK